MKTFFKKHTRGKQLSSACAFLSNWNVQFGFWNILYTLVTHFIPHCDFTHLIRKTNRTFQKEFLLWKQRRTTSDGGGSSHLAPAGQVRVLGYQPAPQPEWPCSHSTFGAEQNPALNLQHGFPAICPSCAAVTEPAWPWSLKHIFSAYYRKCLPNLL